MPEAFHLRNQPLSGAQWLVRDNIKGHAVRYATQKNMANTYTQLNVHLVFAVSNRQSLILPEWETELHKYLSSICKNRGNHIYAINGTTNHVHLMVCLATTESVASLVQCLKMESSKWINKKFLHGDFAWQTGYGAFTYSKSQVESVVKYINNQKEHHKKVPFIEELKQIFTNFGITYQTEYLMKDV